MAVVSREELASQHGDLLFLEELEYDQAILGVTTFGVVVYDAAAVVGIYFKQVQDYEVQLTLEDCWKHFYANIAGNYVGEKTPIFIHLRDTLFIQDSDSL